MPAGGCFAVQSAGGSSFTPRDKDSLLELYDIVHSDISLSDGVLTENQRKLLLQI